MIHKCDHTQISTQRSLIGHVLIFVLLAVIGQGCKSKRSLVYESAQQAPSRAEFLHAIQQSDIDYKYLSAKVKLSFDSPEERGKATLNIRHVRDSAIYIQVRKLGIPISNILIMPDSVWITYRLEQLYERASNDQLSRAFGLNLDFDAFQDLLIGRVSEPDTTSAQVVLQGDSYVMRYRDDAIWHEYELDDNQQYMEQYNRTDRAGNKICTSYAGYNRLSSGEILSMSRSYSTLHNATKHMSSAKLSIAKIVLHEPKTINFKIPDGYDEI